MKKIDFHLQEQLQAYLKDALPPKERKQLEEDIASNPELASEVQFQKGIDLLLEAARRTEIAQELEQIRITQTSPHTSSLWQQPPGWFLVAAAACGLLLAIFMMFPNKKEAEPSYHAVLQAQWQAYPNLLTSALTAGHDSAAWRHPNASSDQSSLLTQAMRWYENGEFEQAYAALQDLSDNSEIEQNGTLFYGGICLMMLERYPDAIEQLSNIVETNQFYYSLAQWQLGMIYMKQNKLSAARRHLTLALSQNQLSKLERQRVQDLLDSLPH